MKRTEVCGGHRWTGQRIAQAAKHIRLALFLVTLLGGFLTSPSFGDDSDASSG